MLFIVALLPDSNLIRVYILMYTNNKLIMSLRASHSKIGRQPAKLQRQWASTGIGPPRDDAVLRYGPRGGLQRQSKQSGEWYSVEKSRYNGFLIRSSRYDDYGNYNTDEAPAPALAPSLDQYDVDGSYGGSRDTKYSANTFYDPQVPSQASHQDPGSVYTAAIDAALTAKEPAPLSSSSSIHGRSHNKGTRIITFISDVPGNFLVDGRPFGEVSGQTLAKTIRYLEKQGATVTRAVTPS